MVSYPGDWEICKFDEVFRIISNNTLSRDKLTSRGNIGNIHYGDVLIKYGTILTANDDIPRIKPEYESSAKIFLRKNDVIIADTAEDETVGKAVQIGDVDIPLVSGLHTIPCRPIVDTAPGYLGYCINSKIYHDQLLPYITGIKVSSISRASIRKTLIPLPPLHEQTAIADTLAVFDRHIANLTELIAKKKAIRDGALDELMSGRTRLEGFCGEWEYKPLLLLCDELVRGPFGGSLKKEDFVTSGIKVYEQKNAIQQDYSIGTYFISPAKYESMKRFTVSSGDFIVSCSGTIGRIYRLPAEAETGIINQALLRIKVNEKIVNPSFFYHVFRAHIIQNVIIDNTQGGAMKNLVGMKQFKQIIFPLPPMKEQTAIADTLTALDKEISSLESERVKISQIRDGAINDLLTGKVRLKNGK